MLLFVCIRDFSKQENWECDALAVPNSVSFTVTHFDGCTLHSNYVIKVSLELRSGFLCAFLKSRHGIDDSSHYACNLKLIVFSPPISEFNNDDVPLQGSLAK